MFLFLGISLFLGITLFALLSPFLSEKIDFQKKSTKWLFILLLLIPFSALSLYGILGNPNLPDYPFQDRLRDQLGLPKEQADQMIKMVKNLAQKLEKEPNNPEGWKMLARSYQALGQIDEANDSLRSALQYGGQDTNTLIAFVETSMISQSGNITAEADQALTQALSQEPTNPQALYYKGLSLLQEGRKEQAITLWKLLEKASPADAPWLPMLRKKLSEVQE